MGVILRKKLNESNPINFRIETEKIIEMLKVLYAEEINAWYQYYIVSNFMQGQERKSIEELFIDTAKDELDDHANKLLKRISELGGNLSYISDINSLGQISNCEYKIPQEPYNTIKLLEDNIESEICAIKHYMELADITKDKDYTTYCMAIEILGDEEEHLRSLQDFYVDITGHEYESNNFENFNSYDISNRDSIDNEIVYIIKEE